MHIAEPTASNLSFSADESVTVGEFVGRADAHFEKASIESLCSVY
ncbi:hypothetical protein [Herbiconiux sp. L3-i23]|nr:hypothetical protein [Herbiconiux sp. L3-i23]BDI22516.1 hypothetical protein L3i23_12920 [Herbiconiux sp. L3-i23]